MSKKNVDEIRKTDILILGAGAAGMRAAIAAAETGVDVILATKGSAAKSGATPMACPSYQAAFAMEDDRDNPEIAFEDTCFEGRYLGDENLIFALTNEATDRAMDMLEYGVKYRKKENGNFLQVVHPGHSFERNLVILGNGYAMASGLKKECLKYPNIHLIEDFVATKITGGSNSINGVIGLDMRLGKPAAIQAPSIILATGGYSELWRWTDTEPGLTGEGLMLGFNVGAELVDLEMMLFYPTGLCYPSEVEGTLVQYEGLMTNKYCHGMMLNGNHEPFLPQTDRLPVRDVMMKLVFREIEEGRASPHGGVYVDLRRSPKKPEEIMRILKALDSLPYNQLSDLGIDVLNEPIEVMPVTHYTLGGVRINEWGETNVSGLFAAGEVSGNVHGANRTSGNALAETQVFGRRAGTRAAEFCKNAKVQEISSYEISEETKRIERFLKEGDPNFRPLEIKRKIKSIMHRYVHHRRDSAGLNTAILSLKEIRENDLMRMAVTPSHRIYNYEWEEALEVEHMVNLSIMVAASALAREESRGHHWRTDFPNMRREWEKHTIAKSSGSSGEFEITDAPVIRLKDRSKERRSADPTLVQVGVLDE